jgi:Uncharacterized conserved protein
MKSKFKVLAGAVIAMTLVFSTVYISKSNIAKAETAGSTVEQVTTITASGEGAIEAAPDVAYVSIGVVTEGKELAKVQAENADKMAKVMASLTKLGIKKEEIKTSNYNVNPKYEWNDKTGVSTIVGYTVNNTLDVTVNDITKTGTILDSAVASGSNSINGVRFALKNETELYNKALELAVKDAKAKAAAMGKGLGITNIQPYKITEISNRNTPVYYNAKTESMDAARAATPISEGELKVTANVSVEFSFK